MQVWGNKQTITKENMLTLKQILATVTIRNV